jgi:predicted MPP superfamily phosphohydrolase
MERAREYLSDHDITILQDNTIEVAGVVIIGRDDVSSSRFGRQRKELSEILEGINKDKPLILLDHQPKKLSAHLYESVLSTDAERKAQTKHQRILRNT